MRFDKILVNHAGGFPIPFLHGVFFRDKRYISITHDYSWLLRMPQPTFSQLAEVEGRDIGSARNFGLRRFLPQLELKTQAQPTADLFGWMTDSLRSIEIVSMP